MYGEQEIALLFCCPARVASNDRMEQIYVVRPSNQTYNASIKQIYRARAVSFLLLSLLLSLLLYLLQEKSKIRTFLLWDFYLFSIKHIEDRLEKNFYISCKEKFREYSKENLLYKCNREIYLVNTFINTLYIVVIKPPAEPFLENNAPLRGVNLDRAQSRVRFIGGCTQLDK